VSFFVLGRGKTGIARLFSVRCSIAMGCPLVFLFFLPRGVQKGRGRFVSFLSPLYHFIVSPRLPAAREFFRPLHPPVMAPVLSPASAPPCHSHELLSFPYIRCCCVSCLLFGPPRPVSKGNCPSFGFLTGASIPLQPFFGSVVFVAFTDPRWGPGGLVWFRPFLGLVIKLQSPSLLWTFFLRPAPVSFLVPSRFPIWRPPGFSPDNLTWPPSGHILGPPVNFCICPCLDAAFA